MEQPVIDLSERQTERLDELDRDHREFHDRVVDRRVQDFFEDLDRGEAPSSRY